MLTERYCLQSNDVSFVAVGVSKVTAKTRNSLRIPLFTAGTACLALFCLSILSSPAARGQVGTPVPN